MFDFPTDNARYRLSPPGSPRDLPSQLERLRPPFLVPRPSPSLDWASIHEVLKSELLDLLWPSLNEQRWLCRNLSIPLLESLTNSSPPTNSATASSAAFAASPSANTTTRTVLPVPCGKLHAPRTIWSAFLGLTPKRTATSTDSSNLVVAPAKTFSSASSTEYWVIESIPSCLYVALSAFWHVVPPSTPRFSEEWGF